MARTNFLANGQIDWKSNVFKNQNSATQERSVYVYEDRTDDNQLSANTI